MIFSLQFLRRNIQKMKREVVKKESSTVEVTVTVDEKSWKEAQEASFKKLAANVEIKGFRKGKAPENLVKEKVKEAEVYNEAINALLPNLYEEVITEEKLQPFARPSVNVTKLDKTELVVVFTII